MSARRQAPAGQRKFRVRVERAGDDGFTAKIAPVDDPGKVVADNGLHCGIIDLVNDILIEMVREEEDAPDGHE